MERQNYKSNYRERSPLSRNSFLCKKCSERETTKFRQRPDCIKFKRKCIPVKLKQPEAQLLLEENGVSSACLDKDFEWYFLYSVMATLTSSKRALASDGNIFYMNEVFRVTPYTILLRC